MKNVLLTVLMSIILLSCSDDPADDPAKTEALTSGTWILTGYTTDYNKDGTYEEDTYAILADCEKDNFYAFNADGSVTRDEGPTKCIESNPQTMALTWSFKDNQKQLQFGGDNYQIEELTPSTLKLKGTTSYNVIYTIGVKLTYSKQ